MDRKLFIRKSALGLGVAFVPALVQCQPNDDPLEKTLHQKPLIIRDNEGEVYNVLGDVQTHKLLGSDTGNQLVEWVDNVEPGVGIPPHIHTKEDEIFRVIEGQLEMMIDNKTIILSAGDTAFAPKNVAHAWTVVGSEKARFITSAFPSGIESMFAELASLPAGPPDFEQVATVCGRYGISFV
jgi:quercetin dioxygenase-like cupin family protein